MARAALLVGVVLTVAWARWSVNGPQARARETAARFWRAVTDGDVGTVRSLLHPDADQTAEELVAMYRTYRYGGGATVTDAAPHRRAQVIVTVGLGKPNGYTTLQLVAMARHGGEWRVLHAGQDYVEAPVPAPAGKE